MKVRGVIEKILGFLLIAGGVIYLLGCIFLYAIEKGGAIDLSQINLDLILNTFGLIVAVPAIFLGIIFLILGSALIRDSKRLAKLEKEVKIYFKDKL